MAFVYDGVAGCLPALTIMELSYIKTTPGRMYSALCSSECTIATESGIIVE